MDLHSNSHTPSNPESNHGIGRGMEFAALLFVFLGAGYVADRLFDTKPVFMVVSVVFALVGQFASLYYSYDMRMKALETERAQGAASAKAKMS